MAPILGALFAILIGFLAIRPYIGYQKESLQNITAANTASQFRQLINVAEAYVQTACLPNENGGVIPSGCQNLALSQLPAGYLPQGTNAKQNPFGQSWYINVTPSSGAAGVVALLYSSGGSPIPMRLAAMIAAQTGQEGGFVPNASLYSVYGFPQTSQLVAVGAFGHWNLSPLASYLPSGSSVEAGNLVALLNIGPGSGATNSGSYLYRDAVQGDTPVAGTDAGRLNTMQTNLGMSGHSVENAGAVSVTTSLPQATTPFLAEMVGTTTNGKPGGMVQTTDGNGNTATIQTDSSGANLSLVGATSSNLSVSGGTSATVNVGPGGSTANTGNTLVLTSAGGAVGQSCSPLNAIAPGTAGPVVCGNNAQGNPVWMTMGSGDFTQVKQYAQVYAGSSIPIPASTRPQFISTDCKTTFSSWTNDFKFYIEFDIYAPSGTLVASTARVDVPASSTNPSGQATPWAPSASTIVPAGDSAQFTVYSNVPVNSFWNTAPSQAGYCNVIITN